jgi:superfamily II DNA/RNA helicase
VSHVINFDVPATPDFYTHRIGRTGRAELQGTAYTFVSAEDYALIHQIERRINKKIPRLDPPVFERRALDDTAPAKAERTRRRGAVAAARARAKVRAERPAVRKAANRSKAPENAAAPAPAAVG